ncbi:MAG: SulP family inorganic anion transporter, partial [Anaerolineae bacterium]|nr:SulP family inorganic anion transporter [Anaerolineae bacterium]
METTEPARHNTLFPNVLAGLIIGFTEIIVAVSLASLVFSGTMNSYLARGIAAMLVTVVVHLVITGLFSSFKNAISSIQDNPVVVLSVSVVALLGSNPLASDELFATVIALILTMTLLTGVFLVLLGTFRLGGLVRYIPYPVIGGFLAGTGWLLAQGGIGSMISYPLNLTTLGNLFAADQLGLWFPGTVFGLLLFFAVQRLNHWAVLPAMLLGGLVLFYVVLLFSGTSIEQAIANGLLLGNLGDRSIWQPLPLGELTQADWGAI